MSDIVKRERVRHDKRVKKTERSASRREYESLRSQLSARESAQEPSTMVRVVKRHPVASGVAVTTVTFALAWFAWLSPQLDKASVADTERVSVEDQNTSMQAQLPQLRSQLTVIAPQLTELRDLASKVPSIIDQPALYDDLAKIADDSGVTSLSSLKVGLPTPIEATSPTIAEPVDGEQAPGEAPVPVGGPSIASYQVDLTVDGTMKSIELFLEGVRTGTRLAVIEETRMTMNPDGSARAMVKAIFYLQQVDVDGLATQLENLLQESGINVAEDQGPTDEPDGVDGSTGQVEPEMQEEPAGDLDDGQGLPPVDED